MKKFFLIVFITLAHGVLFAQVTSYNKREVMIPMRDGVKLYTVILTPKEATGPLPILILRTPYGAEVPNNYNPVNSVSTETMAKEGYIFVRQDIRGKYKSEGKMEIHQPITHV